MRILFAASFLATLLTPTLQAQGLRPSVGLSLQAYPAGQIGVVYGTFTLQENHSLGVHAGYNRTRRQDFGKHDNEQGGGPGFGARWRYYPNARQAGLHVGARMDLWFLDIDWRWDDPTDKPLPEGTTEITVLQPTTQLGYGWLIASNRLAVEATVSLGLEINVETQGEPVGEGAILLGGLSIAYRL